MKYKDPARNEAEREVRSDAMNDYYDTTQVRIVLDYLVEKGRIDNYRYDDRDGWEIDTLAHDEPVRLPNTVVAAAWCDAFLTGFRTAELKARVQ